MAAVSIIWTIIGLLLGVMALSTIPVVISGEEPLREKFTFISAVLVIAYLSFLPIISVGLADYIVKKESEVIVRSREDVNYHILEAVVDDEIHTGNFEKTFEVSYVGQKVSYQYMEKDTMFFPKFERFKWVIVSDTPK